MPSSFPVLRASPSEKTCKLAIVFFNGSALSANTEFDPPQRAAGSLRHALAGPGIGNQCGHLTGIRKQHSTFQRYHRNAGQALEFQTDLGVRIEPGSLRPPRSSH